MRRPNTGPLACFSLLLGAAVFCAQFSEAPASEWKPFGLQGRVVRSIAAAPDLLCAGAEGQGVHCIELGSLHSRWRSLGPGGATILWLWIDPLDAEVRFAAADGSSGGPTLYRSLDGGGSWEPIENMPVPMGGVPRVFMVEGVPATGTVIAAGGHIWRTDDLGDSWNLLSPEGGLFSLEIARTDPETIWVGGETVLFMGFTRVSRDAGVTWTTVWDSRLIGDNQTSSISAHPDRDGLVLTGHEGFILCTEDHGEEFNQVLTAPARFFIDWDGDHPSRVYGAGSPNDPQGHAFVSRDLGISWSDVTGLALSERMIFQLAADHRRPGVVYVATDDGVYRFYGGGLPLCLDTTVGLGALRLWPGECPPPSTQGPSAGNRDPATPDSSPASREPIPGDAIAFPIENVRRTANRIDLGEVECLVDGDVALVTIDPPDPVPGRAVAILVRAEGDHDYGRSSDGIRRLPSTGDCP